MATTSSALSNAQAKQNTSGSTYSIPYSELGLTPGSYGYGVKSSGAYGSNIGTAGYTPGSSTTTTSNPSSVLPQYGNESGLLSGLGSDLSSLLGSNTGQLATYAGLYDLISGQAENAQSENDTLAGEISAIGKPAVSESQSLLGAYSSGELTTPFQEQLQSALNANQNAATSQEAQSASLLAGASGGQNLSGAVASQYQQITNAQAQNNTTAVSNAFAGELSASDSLLSAGGSYVQSGITQEINSNTQLQSQLSSLMASLASAYAQGTSSSSSGSSGSSGKSSGGGGSSGSGGSGGTGNSSGTSSSDTSSDDPYGQPSGTNGNYGTIDYNNPSYDPFSTLGIPAY